MPTDTEMLDWMADGEAQVLKHIDPSRACVFELIWVDVGGKGQSVTAPDLRTAVAKAMEAK